MIIPWLNIACCLCQIRVYSPNYCNTHCSRDSSVIFGHYSAACSKLFLLTSQQCSSHPCCWAKLLVSVAPSHRLVSSTRDCALPGRKLYTTAVETRVQEWDPDVLVIPHTIAVLPALVGGMRFKMLCKSRKNNLMNIPPTVPSIYPREVQVYYVYCTLSCIKIIEQIHSKTYHLWTLGEVKFTNCLVRTTT